MSTHLDASLEATVRSRCRRCANGERVLPRRDESGKILWLHHMPQFNAFEECRAGDVQAALLLQRRKARTAIA